MSPKHRESPEISIAAEDLRPVLERALQIDAQRPTPIALAELQRIGEEIGISPESIARAVAEFKSDEAERVVSATRLTRRLETWAKTAVIGAAMFLGGVALGQQNDVVSFWLFVITALAALYYRRRGKADDYLREMLVVAGAFGAGWFIASGLPGDADTIWHLIVPGAAGILAGFTLLRRKEVLRILLGRDSDGAMH
jgi:hypothetical protein